MLSNWKILPNGSKCICNVKLKKCWQCCKTDNFYQLVRKVFERLSIWQIRQFGTKCVGNIVKLTNFFRLIRTWETWFCSQIDIKWYYKWKILRFHFGENASESKEFWKEKASISIIMKCQIDVLEYSFFEELRCKLYVQLHDLKFDISDVEEHFHTFLTSPNSCHNCPSMTWTYKIRNSC